MKAIKHSDPQDFQRSQNENAIRPTPIILQDDEGRIIGTRLIKPGLAENSPSKYPVLEFQVGMRNPGKMLRPLDVPHFEWTVQLAAAHSATIQNFLAPPQDQWKARVSSIISGCPAGLGTETNRGRIPVAKREAI
jgi:hypothetical protein